LFDRVRAFYLDDEEYAELQGFLMRNPEASAVVPGSGGVQKLRWRRETWRVTGHLLRRLEPNEIWLLTVYAKTKQENIRANLLKQLKEAFQND